MTAAIGVVGVFVLGLVTPVVLFGTARRFDREARAHRRGIPIGRTTPELTEYYRKRVAHSQRVVLYTFIGSLVTATAFAWAISGSPIAGAGAFVAVMVMASFGSLGFRVWVAGKTAGATGSGSEGTDT